MVYATSAAKSAARHGRRFKPTHGEVAFLRDELEGDVLHADQGEEDRQRDGGAVKEIVVVVKEEAAQARPADEEDREAYLCATAVSHTHTHTQRHAVCPQG